MPTNDFIGVCCRFYLWIFLIISAFKLIILVPTFSESKSYCTNSSSVFCTIHLFLEKNALIFPIFPFFSQERGTLKMLRILIRSRSNSLWTPEKSGKICKRKPTQPRYITWLRGFRNLSDYVILCGGGDESRTHAKHHKNWRNYVIFLFLRHLPRHKYLFYSSSTFSRFRSTSISLCT